MTNSETAYAKINLALHVRARRDDGYHELETLFAFVNAGDRLTAHASNQDALRIAGEFAPQLGDPFSNLAVKALRVLPHAGGLSIALEKNLPVAAGLGGGSADAGAVFRLIRARFGLPDDWRDRAARLGADVPACVDSKMVIGRGVGDDFSPIENDLAGMAVLLVNPRMALETGPVFAAWDGRDKGPLPSGKASIIAQQGRNDLIPPAVTLCPPILAVLEALGRTDPWLARMSGSGASCFALYASGMERDRAAQRIADDHPDWWQTPGKLL